MRHSSAARGGSALRPRLARHGRHAGPVAPHAGGARHHRGRHPAPAPGGAARARDHEVCPTPRPPRTRQPSPSLMHQMCRCCECAFIAISHHIFELRVSNAVRVPNEKKSAIRRVLHIYNSCIGIDVNSVSHLRDSSRDYVCTK